MASASAGGKDVRNANEDIHSELRNLRLDDMVALSQTKALEPAQTIIGRQIEWFQQSLYTVGQLVEYWYGTWTDLVRGAFTFSLSIGDRISMFFFAIGASVIIFVICIWCIISTNPTLVTLYQLTLGRSAAGLSLVNGMNPKLFENMTGPQSAKAKQKLSEPPKQNDGSHSREFSIDIAKMLLQISSLMYERENTQTVNALKVIRKFINPAVQRLPLRPASSVAAEGEPSGSVADNLIGNDTNIRKAKDAINIQERESRKVIDDWVTKYGLEYEPVSELASLSQAYASIFWDRNSNWMVVAFKGTDPRSFEEWATDFTARFENASMDISGFKNVHRGFKERMFPTYILRGQRPPWETIAKAIEIVAEKLYSVHQKDINVWFTGHSLGTALATMAYCKALIDEQWSEHIIIRDSYLFATPITVDKQSRYTFNDHLYGASDYLRTMWRVTNRDDFVATGLPALGDGDKRPYDAGNLFGFSHLGIEIFMKSGPRQSEVKGNVVKGTYTNYGTYGVSIVSEFTPREVLDQRAAAVKGKLTLLWMYKALQYIPLVGRLAAHATVNYYDQLDQIALAECKAR